MHLEIYCEIPVRESQLIGHGHLLCIIPCRHRSHSSPSLARILHAHMSSETAWQVYTTQDRSP